MSAVITPHFESQPSDQPANDTPVEMPDIAIEEPQWEPRRVHVPRPLVWGILILFGLVIVVMGVWGLVRGSGWYGTPVDSATSAHLAQIHRELLAAGVPETSLRHLARAAQSGTYKREAIELLESADQDLKELSGNPAVASARTELLAILGDLSVNPDHY